MIFNLYGAKVAAGEWRDYALGFHSRQGRVLGFPPRKRSASVPEVKNPELCRAAGRSAVIAATGLVLRRGHDLSRVVRVLDRGLKIVGAE